MKDKIIKYRTPNQFSKIIDETEELRLEYEFESTYLVQKSNNQILMEDDFYGDPQCGVIDENNKWAIVGGRHLIFWIENLKKHYETEEFKDIYAIRIKEVEVIHILTDPWAEFSAIWELSIKSGKLSKVSEFKKYQGKEYIENVEW